MDAPTAGEDVDVEQLVTAHRATREPSGWGVADLRELLAGGRSAGELLVRYQPVVRTCDGEPLAAEALVRWRRPDGSLVAPDGFVGVAEAHGLGAALDELVLHEALHQVLRWDAAGVRVHRVGVNLGRSSIERPDLVEAVARACACAGTGPDRLVLEVLEHERLHLDDGVLDRLQALADAGTTLAVDDFGCGYGDVGRLAQLPVGLVKLDRSLLPGSGTPLARTAPDAERLLAAVTALARGVGAEVTAEGVETPEQRAACARAGIGHLQGWLFAPALEPDAVVDLWRSYAASATAPGQDGGAAQPPEQQLAASSS
ncbi:EAL domain-containing protein [Streptomyces sp. NP160]|uniref:EAL domain-containing protein n=1 Tax=Streptomyces sp. NP160 TaxID=2586637 RepID=UPI0015D57D30|nr:EAL domain-containing protein [Streptomyces sp. NP160]